MKFFKISILIIAFLQVINCQEMSEMRINGQPEYLPNELISYDRKDINGQVCFGLLIYTDLTGLSFDSNNGVTGVNEDIGSYLLFLSPDERMVKVRKIGYKPLDIILSEHGIKTESGKVWKIEITGTPTPDLIPINIVVDQSDIVIFIDDESKGSNATQQVSIGKHRLMIKKEGFKAITDSIVVSPEKTLFRYTMEVIKAVVVTFKSVPDGATILLDGIDKGRTTRQIFEVPGRYTLRLQKYGYNDLIREIEIKEGEKNDFNFELIKNAGYLTINTTPIDAALFIDGVPKTTGQIEVEAGQHIIEVSKQNYITIYDTVQIKLGERISKSYELVKNTAFLNLAISPSDASIQINQEIFNANENIEIPAGSCLLEISKEGYETYSETIQIARGQTATREITLVPIFGTIQLIILPIEAKINLCRGDEVIDSWTGSVMKDSILVGKYTLKAECPGFKNTTREINVSKGQTTLLDIELVPGSVAGLKINSITTEGNLLSNARFKEENNTFVINYDLTGDFSEDYEVNVFLMDTKNPGYKYELTKISGDTGEGKFAGRGRKIVWNFEEEFKGGLVNDNLFLKLVVEESGGSTWYYWVGAAVVGGVVAAILLKPVDGPIVIPEPPDRP